MRSLRADSAATPSASRCRSPRSACGARCAATSGRRCSASPILPPVQRDAAFFRNLSGGAVSAALTLPIGISLGIVTLEPLGPHFAPLGVAAGVYGIVICSLLTVLFGSRGALINVPRSVTAVFVGAMLF